MSGHSPRPYPQFLGIRHTARVDRGLERSTDTSVAVDRQLEPTPPPVFLFDGTATRFLGAIRQRGLVRGTRRYVHLSASQGLAESVGRRHGQPAILIVRARALHAAGRSLFLSSNGVWLTNFAPSNFLEFPEYR